MLRVAAVLTLVVVGCGTKSQTGGPANPPGTTACAMQGVTLAGQGDLPSLAWMRSGQLDPNTVAVDADGNVFVAGESLAVDLGGGPLVGDPANGYDAFLVSYTKTGEHR